MNCEELSLDEKLQQQARSLGSRSARARRALGARAARAAARAWRARASDVPEDPEYLGASRSFWKSVSNIDWPCVRGRFSMEDRLRRFGNVPELRWKSFSVNCVGQLMIISGRLSWWETV
jgi:septal ring factor EnvC (AmiA/AmiB activator)